MTKIFRFLPFFPIFTLFGLLNLALFFLVEAIGPEIQDTASGQLLIGVLRVTIIPQWIARILVVVIGGVLFGFSGSSFPIWYEILAFPVLFLPYFLADFALAKFRGKSKLGTP